MKSEQSLYYKAAVKAVIILTRFPSLPSSSKTDNAHLQNSKKYFYVKLQDTHTDILRKTP